MRNKIIVSLILLVLTIGLFDLDLTQITDDILNAVFPQTEQTPTKDEYADIMLDGKSVAIGDTLNTVVEKFGDSIDTLMSEYGFYWYIYHNNYKDYIQIGIKDDKIAGIYSNSPAFYISGITVGASFYDVCTAFGEPLEYIVKGNTRYKQNRIIHDKRQMDVFLYKNMYITFFYDVFKNDTVTAVSIIEKNTEESFQSAYAAASQDLKYSFEKQNFYVVNATRVREGLSALKWSDNVAQLAEAHSKDMAENHYFDHVNPKGQSVSDRAKEVYLRYSLIGENIASGAQNSIVMHELLMNSEGHRKNLLNEYQYLGVGVWFNEDNIPYLTQNFYSPPKIIFG